MGLEFEAKFLDINKNKMIEKLKKIGATLVHDKIMLKRTVFHLANNNIKGYARIRDNGNNITLTSKTYANPKFPEENEIIIKEDYETGKKFLNSLGLIEKANQESYREKWSHELAHEITFDTLPGLPTYMEIDCTSEEKLNKLIDLLELDKTKMRFGSFDKTYNEYYDIDIDIINNKTPSLTFNNILNEIKPLKNKNLLKKIYKLELGIVKNPNSKKKNKISKNKKNSKNNKK
jgi:adenylate cyclase class IV